MARIPAVLRRSLDGLHNPTVGGVAMLVAAVVALVWANSPWEGLYTALRDTEIGIASLHLELTVGHWAADGLLAIFFLVVGLELKEEFVNGELSDPRRARLPIIAAFCGMAVPALIYTAVSFGTPGAAAGWAIPMATDIALAVAVLAVAGGALPLALRVFLLTLAVVDDLGAIAVIAVFYTDHLELGWLGATVAVLAVYWGLQRLGVRGAWIYIPLGVLAWAFMHYSGVHATIAGVAIGLLTRLEERPGESESPLDRTLFLAQPISTGLAIPLFALFSAGVALTPEALERAVADPVAIGIVLGLVFGKFIGILGGSWLSVRLGFAKLSDELGWRDIGAAAALAGIGFTVALLIGELAYGGTERYEEVKIAVLTASAIAATVAVVLLRLQIRRRRRQAPSREEVAAAAREHDYSHAEGVFGAAGPFAGEEHGAHPAGNRPNSPPPADPALPAGPGARPAAGASGPPPGRGGPRIANAEGAAEHEGAARMSVPQTGRLDAAEREPTAHSLGDLVALATQDVSELVRGEIELAKLEIARDTRRVAIGVVLGAIAAFMGHLVLILLSMALALGIAAFGLPDWAGFLIAAGVYVLVAVVLIFVASRWLRNFDALKRTRETLGDDLAMLRRGSELSG
ncbi:Na+/H+ antiporter NhaA [Allonocardiopsis opalescens]|uniref:Na(+)/H(+) antiporter NhaA n=1 Tax=Allonocardiopsis opalescens TaxID=1144618 RepID=A0A2T0Q6R0_9ACTN|nr:Na+/H+ antiporter NhaA [Allonocardiopsis opalescens]PRX99481.1 Na+/H+ antiporter NhaA [Allonocardiopsis opalescens]